MSVYCNLLLVVLLFTGSSLANSMVFNVSLDKQDLANSNHQDVLLASTVNIYCPDEMETYLIVNVEENMYNSCPENPGMKVIGSCVHSPLYINVNKLAIAFPDLVSYEIGNTYYFAAYSTNYGQVYSNTPCLDGMKFSFNVVASLENQIAPSSSAAIEATPTLSYHDVISNTLNTSPSDMVPSSTTPPSLSSTTSFAPSLSSTIRRTTATPTSTSPPTASGTVATQFDTDPDDDIIVDGIADSALPVAGSSWCFVIPLLLSSVLLFTML